MSLERILEPEVMDSPQDAEDYDRMDHSQVNRVFVDDLLASLASRFKVQSSKFKVDVNDSTLNIELETLNLMDSASYMDALDLGAGTAQIPIELCRRLADCRVTAVDAAASMLDLARRNVAAAGLTERIQPARVDAKSLPYADGTFDIVMSNSIIHHIPEPLAVLREAVRVTKQEGWLFFRDLLRPDSEQQLQHLVATYAADCNDHQRQLFADSLHAALSLDEIRGLITRLGFPPKAVQQTSDRHWTWSSVKHD